MHSFWNALETAGAMQFRWQICMKDCGIVLTDVTLPILAVADIADKFQGVSGRGL